MVDVPTISVAKKRLCGRFAALDPEPGSRQPLIDKGEQTGWVWRSKARCNPLFVATGHRVSLNSALHWVEKVHGLLSSTGTDALGGIPSPLTVPPFNAGKTRFNAVRTALLRYTADGIRRSDALSPYP